MCGYSPNTYCGTESIHIKHLMSHYDDFILILKQLSECMSLYSGFYSGLLFHSLSLAAEVPDIILSLYHSLISASSKRHIHSHPCKFIVSCKILTSVSYTDTQSDTHFIADIYSLYILQDVKPYTYCRVQVFFIYNKEKLILLKFFYNTVESVYILIYLPVNQSLQKRASYLFHAFHGLIVVVHIHKSDYKL